MSRARELAKLGNTDAVGIDGVDLRAGSVSAGTNLDVASNINVAGVITATNYFGEASGLTGLTAVGVGVTVLRNDSSIGAATKINFDNTFTVTDISSGITTVASGVATGDPRSTTLVVSGISTFGGVKLTGVTTASNQVNLDNTNVTTGILTVAGQTELANVTVSAGATSSTLNVSGQSVLSNVNVGTGICTVAGQLIAGHVSAGVITATQFSGPLTGVTTGATEAANAFGLLGTPNITINDIAVGGVSTYTGVSNLNNTLNVNASADILGNLDVGSVTTGIGTITALGSSGVTVSGAVTATSFVGALTGNVTGTATTASGLTGTALINTSGIVTATSFKTIDLGNGIGGIITSTSHVDSGITTYYGDSSYSAALRWVLGADGSNHYTFTGPGLGHSTQNDPTLYLKRGQTYMFENKMGAHPFRIQSTTNGATGTAWNVGVTNNDVSNGVLIFEVPFATPDTLYYQCTAHANMGGVINIA